jgi:hypothetical protein
VYILVGERTFFCNFIDSDGPRDLSEAKRRT